MADKAAPNLMAAAQNHVHHLDKHCACVIFAEALVGGYG